MSMRRWVAAAIVCLLLLAVVGWMLVARHDASRVSVGWTLDCPKGTVVTRHHQPFIQSRTGWRCEVDLLVTNRSGRSVHVTHLNSPLLGSGGGAEIRGYSTQDARIHDLGGADQNDVDAVYDVDLTVPGHTSRAMTLSIGWREQGCNSAAEFGLPRWPEIEFRLGLMTFHRKSAQTLNLQTFDDGHDPVACGLSTD